MRVDAAALTDIDAATIGRWFQVSDDNPLVGLDGRAALLRRLGDVLDAAPTLRADVASLRAVRSAARATRTLSAPAILRALLDRLRPDLARTGQRRCDGVRILGDAWRHPHAGGDGPTAGWVPFHKLSQWLAYSLFEPFEWAGVRGRPTATR